MKCNCEKLFHSKVVQMYSKQHVQSNVCIYHVGGEERS